MIVIKKLAFIIVLILVMGIFSGCSETPLSVTEPDVFMVSNKNGKKVVRLGDKQEDTIKLLDPKDGGLSLDLEFEEENVQRVAYWDSEGIAVDYKDGAVYAIRINNKDWETANGLKEGISLADARAFFPADQLHEYEQSEGLWISYDLEGNPIEFSLESPFYIHVSSKDGVVTQITIQDNR